MATLDRIRCLPFRDADSLRDLLEAEHAVILKVSPAEIRQRALEIASALGAPLAQNIEGDRVIDVYDRGGSMQAGARYHQTRQGGALHTDNVNIAEPWDVMILACARPATIGGETILVSALDVVAHLRAHFPQTLPTLESPFFWDNRGFSKNVFSAPIITWDENREPRFRYLRTYLEAAHERAERPLDATQVHALDALDATLELPSLQTRRLLAAGEMLVTIDSTVIHGRTAFVDRDATSGRLCHRIWVAFS